MSLRSRFSSSANRILLPLAGALILGLGFVLLWGIQNRSPVLEKLEPTMGHGGSLVRLWGRNFGEGPMRSRLVVGRHIVPPSDIKSWSDTLIEFFVPTDAGSGPLTLTTAHGTTRGLFWIDRQDVPLILGSGVEKRDQAVRIHALDPSPVRISEPIVIKGIGFGTERGKIFFTWGPVEAGNLEGYPLVSADPSEVEVWEDRRIVVRVPTGATSGTVTVLTRSGTAASSFVEVDVTPGVQAYSSRRRLVLEIDAAVRWNSSHPSSTSILIPVGVEDWRQKALAISRSPPPELGSFELVEGNLEWKAPGRFSGEVETEWEVVFSVYAVEAQLNGALIDELKPFPAVERYLASSEEVSWNNELFRTFSLNVGGWPAPGRGPLVRARGLFNWIVANFRWNEPEQPSLEAALRLSRGSSWQGCLVLIGLLRASRIPARWVKGYLVTAARQLIPHHWIEIYLGGVGWVSIDPVLASGNAPQAFTLPANAAEYYFGNLDNRRLTTEKEGRDGVNLEQPSVLWHSTSLTAFF